MSNEQTAINPIENQREEALRHYRELSDKCRHWSSFVEHAIKAYNPKEASLPVEQVKNFMAHAYFQGALDRAEKKASEAAFNNWYGLNKDAFSLNPKEENNISQHCDAMGHYGGFPKPEGICPKCGRGWDLTKEENNISQLQEVSPASVVCCDGNCKESENCELKKIDSELIEFASHISLQNLNNNPCTEGNSIEQAREDAEHSGGFYYDLFKFFSDEHGLTLVDTEIQDIIHAVNKFEKWRTTHFSD